MAQGQYCKYSYNFQLPFGGGYPYNAIININGLNNPPVLISSENDLDNLFSSYGFTKESSGRYFLNGVTQTIFGTIQFLNTITSPFCDFEYNLIPMPLLGIYPYTASLIINGTPTSPVTITNQSDLDYFFEVNGFTKNNDSDYITSALTQKVYGNALFTATQSVCTGAGITSTIPLQEGIYDTGGYPFTFNSFSITLGGNPNFITGTYTEISQIVDVLNSLQSGAGYFYPISNRQFLAKINSNTANYFGEFDGISPLPSTSSNNGYVFDISGLSFPLTSGAKVTIDGVLYSTTSPLLTPTDLVAWLNTLSPLFVQGIFILTNSTTITVSHYSATLDESGVTYPTTKIVAQFHGAYYTMTTPAANGSDIVTWLNTLVVGAFGIYRFGGSPHTIYYIGPQIWGLLTWVTSDNSGTIIANSSTNNAALSLITELDGCSLTETDVSAGSIESGCITTTPPASTTQSGCFSLPVPLNNTPQSVSLQSRLTGKVQKAIVKNGCQIIKWTSMGRDITAIRLKQFKLLNMQMILSNFPTEDQVYVMSCYFDLHLLKP